MEIIEKLLNQKVMGKFECLPAIRPKIFLALLQSASVLINTVLSATGMENGLTLVNL